MSDKSESLYKRLHRNLTNRRERILNKKINSISWGLPRFEKTCPGIEQGKYYLLTGQTKSAKTQLTDSLFLFNPIQQIVDKGLNIKLKIFYFSLELSKEEKMLACFSNILYLKEGIRIPPVELKSTRAGIPVSDEILSLLNKYEDYFNKIEEMVEFIDDVRHPTGIYDIVRKYALANGKIHYREIDIDGEIVKVEDYYEPNDPDEYVMIIIDHISLVQPEKRNGQVLSLHETMSLLSSEYLIKLRNRFNYIPIVVQQQALAGENLEHKKNNSVKPSIANLADNKLTIRDCNVAIGIFSPYRYEIPKYFGYDIEYFKDNIRFIEVLVSRDGGAGDTFPLFFDGAVNYFTELPLPTEKSKIQNVYEHIASIR